jgi:fumarylacetoacetase
MTQTLKSWLTISEESDFGIENIPFGIVQTGDGTSIATRIGDTVVKLNVLAANGFFDQLDIEDLWVFSANVLNPFIDLGKPTTNAVRRRLQFLLSDDCSELSSQPDLCKQAYTEAGKAIMLMPVAVGDYTDFYSSIEHATNVGIMFRDPANALFPNWKHLPVGYHGRSSSIVVSGTNFHRPKGQTKPAEDAELVFGPSRQLDFELEMAFISCGSTELGQSIAVSEAEEHIFGLVLFNDLSARDIQKWEYVPLGPFLSKSFASIVSPWVVTLEALAPFRVEGPAQTPAPLPYLLQAGANNFDIKLEVWLKPEHATENLICRSNFKYMYWSMFQQLAHQTIAGCNINTGDLYGSGTISGPTPDSYGSMLELCWKGTKPLTMSDGSQRVFLLDNDTIVMKAYAQKGAFRVGFGECITTVLPAKS